MSISITLHRSGTSRTQQVDTTTTGLDLFGSDRAVVAMRVDGNLVELNIPVGTLTLAEQTDNVIFSGNVNASGEIATTGSTHESRAFYSDPAGTTPVTAATDLLTTDIYVSDGAGGFTIAASRHRRRGSYSAS